MASHHLFDVTEIVEEILTYLPMKDLARVQRVCGKWKCIIDGSSMMKQTLFLHPASVDLVLEWKAK